MKSFTSVLILSQWLISGVISIDSNNVQFYLTTRELSTRILDNGNISQIDPKLSIKVIIHGWRGSAMLPEIEEMTKALLEYAAYNVIRVDYEKIAEKNYLITRSSVCAIGKITGDFLFEVIQEFGYSTDNIHLIGHSLGAHVSSCASRRILKLYGAKIHRISGLDPAGPLFETTLVKSKLKKGDARIVDIVHTNSGLYGYKYSHGSVDFYANGGGPFQPGCLSKSLWHLDFLRRMTLCSHFKSYTYYTASISENYTATQCDSWRKYKKGGCSENKRILFGFHMPENATGNFYFSTENVGTSDFALINSS